MSTQKDISNQDPIVGLEAELKTAQDALNNASREARFAAEANQNAQNYKNTLETFWKNIQQTDDAGSLVNNHLTMMKDAVETVTTNITQKELALMWLGNRVAGEFGHLIGLEAEANQLAKEVKALENKDLTAENSAIIAKLNAFQEAIEAAKTETQNALAAVGEVLTDAKLMEGELGTIASILQTLDDSMRPDEANLTVQFDSEDTTGNAREAVSLLVQVPGITVDNIPKFPLKDSGNSPYYQAMKADFEAAWTKPLGESWHKRMV
ncbi:MAG: hypothetical protein AAF206_30575 [Bacteroidota bacterium]